MYRLDIYTEFSGGHSPRPRWSWTTWNFYDSFTEASEAGNSLELGCRKNNMTMFQVIEVKK
jgi:hypothetical protein